MPIPASVRPDPDTGHAPLPTGGPQQPDRMRTSGVGRFRARSSPALPRSRYYRSAHKQLTASLAPPARRLQWLLTMEAAHALYRQRDPKVSPLYQLIVDHYDELKEVYRDRLD